MPILVVQMGHAGRTSGATGAPGEQAYTQEVGAACARLLNRGGWSVRTIVADPPDAQYRGDAFVAVHADGSNNPDVRGASVGHQTPEGLDLAHAWRAAYKARGFTGPWNADNYTVNLGQYYGVRTAVAQGNRRACIIECGTITNADDRALMAPDRVARAVGDALGIATEEEDVLTDAEIERIWRWKTDELVTIDPHDTLQAYEALAAARADSFHAAADIAALTAKVDALAAKVDALTGTGAKVVGEGSINVKLVSQ